MAQFPDKQALLYWTDHDQRLMAAHILDLMKVAYKSNSVQATPFLPQIMRQWSENIALKLALDYLVVSGFPEGERVRLVFGRTEQAVFDEKQWISMLHIVPQRNSAKLEHRQVLGSLMSLGIEREVVGDICAGKTGYYVAVLPQIASYLEHNWSKVGGEVISVVTSVSGPLQLEEVSGERRRITVTSSRIDGILAAGFNLSRTQAQELIRQGKVKINDRVVSKPDRVNLAEERISCRGFGRLHLLDEAETRKGRIAWTVEIFRSQQ